MTFTESFRMERVYFEKLKNNITDIKNLLAAGNTEDARILLENSVDVDGAVLLLYRNLGECWAELADQIKKTREELDALKEATEAYHDELNEKIDNVNFVLLRLINALDARLTIVENELATMPRVKFLSLVYDETESAYSIQDAYGETVSFEDVSEMAEFPHFIVLTDANGNYYTPEEYTDSGFLWHIDNYNTTVDVYSDISVILASDDSVTVSESTLPKLSEGFGIDITSDNEIEVDTTVIQEKLTAGTGIDIDSNNKISSTVKGNFAVNVTEDSASVLTSDKTYAQIKAAIDAGQNVTLALVEYAAQDVEKVFKLQDNDETSGSEALTFVYDEIDNGVSATQTLLTITNANVITKNNNVINNGVTYTAGAGININSQNKIINTGIGGLPNYNGSDFYNNQLTLFSFTRNADPTIINEWQNVEANYNYNTSGADATRIVECVEALLTSDNSYTNITGTTNKIDFDFILNVWFEVTLFQGRTIRISGSTLAGHFLREENSTTAKRTGGLSDVHFDLLRYYLTNKRVNNIQAYISGLVKFNVAGITAAQIDAYLKTYYLRFIKYIPS